MSTYPRVPSTKEKQELAAIVFPTRPFNQIDFTDVWMLAEMYPTHLDFNCFSWSLLANHTIPIPGTLDTFNHLANIAIKKYRAPFNYVPTTFGGSNAVITVWGSAQNDIMHASRICSKSLLLKYAAEFNLKFDFDEASGFPDSVWSSKFGDRQSFITHPKDWLNGGIWGSAQEDLEVKQD